MNGEKDTALKIYKIGRGEGVSGVDLKMLLPLIKRILFWLYIACQIFKNVARSRRI